MIVQPIIALRRHWTTKLRSISVSQTLLNDNFYCDSSYNFVLTILFRIEIARVRKQLEMGLSGEEISAFIIDSFIVM